MEIKIGRKYLDDNGVYLSFILEVTEVSNSLVSYRAKLFREDGDCYPTECEDWHSTIYRESIEKFQRYKPLYIEVKATRLARKMFPNAEEENGMLILEE
mgnify:CR=1 FL=1